MGLLVVSAAMAWALGHRTSESPQGIVIPWYVLALLFAAAEVWVFHIQVGREAESISLSEIPLVLGLFYAVPQDQLLARFVGFAFVVLLLRRQTMLKSAVNISLAVTDCAVAIWVFQLVGGGSTHDGAREWAGAVLGAAAAMALDLLVLNVIIRWYDGASPLPSLRATSTTIGIAAACATIGLVPVLTLRLGAMAGIPLLVAGLVLMLAYRAYASLAERHTSLERLFSFSREISVAPEDGEVLPSVLRQARELLRAESAEVLRFGDGDEVGLWRYDGEHLVTLGGAEAERVATLVRHLLPDSEPRLLRADHALTVGARAGAHATAHGAPEPGADLHGGARRASAGSSAVDRARTAYLRDRGVMEAVIAPLRFDGQAVGAIAVHDRLGEVRGFTAGDTHLLQTVANHASVALHNELLIGRLRHDALHDALTMLPNRNQLTTAATIALNEARASKERIAVMIIDLNGFKTVNDTLGHHVGDELIREVARRFADTAPPGVLVARLGGDEFAVLMRPGRDGSPIAVADELLEALVPPFVIGNERLHLSGSVGIALAPEHGTSVSDLLKRADIAMYAAKNGAQAAIVYRPDIDVNDPSVLSLMGELRQAIADGQVGIEVEPVMALATGTPVAAEALVRWHHPLRGTLRPGLFLPLAERNGLIVPLTELVLDRAVHAAAQWVSLGLDLRISVNLSARSLLDTSLPSFVATVLERHRLPPERLILEITESIVLSDADRALGLLADLRELGVQLSLDDFGTGYSSLTHLSELPIQQLKIDRSFVSNVQESARDRAIVSAVTGLAGHLDLEVVAEGVESLEIAQALADLGIELAQGHFFAMSMAPELLPVWIATRPVAGLGSAVAPAPPADVPTARERLLRAVT